MSDESLPRETHRGVLKIGALEIEVIHLDNGERLISPEGLAAFLRALAEEETDDE